ncbi:hypothetical protein AVEN_267678-1 [Araneus ventricosus]|uniref:Uncharacterized protein n=1 Tax=Araneus ventricosus TaxID=182803 RepID=A0A4Y2N3V0_ARAVE|nr:hypothetical protein AVEN_267678-1 [Araneus ventricosus]
MAVLPPLEKKNLYKLGNLDAERDEPLLFTRRGMPWNGMLLGGFKDSVLTVLHPSKLQKGDKYKKQFVVALSSKLSFPFVSKPGRVIGLNGTFQQDLAALPPSMQSGDPERYASVLTCRESFPAARNFRDLLFPGNFPRHVHWRNGRQLYGYDKNIQIVA